MIRFPWRECHEIPQHSWWEYPIVAGSKWASTRQRGGTLLGNDLSLASGSVCLSTEHPWPGSTAGSSSVALSFEESQKKKKGKNAVSKAPVLWSSEKSSIWWRKQKACLWMQTCQSEGVVSASRVLELQLCGPRSASMLTRSEASMPSPLKMVC